MLICLYKHKQSHLYIASTPEIIVCLLKGGITARPIVFISSYGRYYSTMTQGNLYAKK